MFEKLMLMEQRYEEISEKLSDPEVVSDNKLYTQLMKEFKNLTPIIEKYREYVSAKKRHDEAKELLDGGGLDKDFKEMAQAELEESKEETEKITEELKILLLPKDPNDDKNVIIEIRVCSATSFPISSASFRTLPDWNFSVSRLPKRSRTQRQSRTTTATPHRRAASGLKCFEFRSPTSTSSSRATASTRQKSTGRT